MDFSCYERSSRDHLASAAQETIDVGDVTAAALKIQVSVVPVRISVFAGALKRHPINETALACLQVIS